MGACGKARRKITRAIVPLHHGGRDFDFGRSAAVRYPRRMNDDRKPDAVTDSRVLRYQALLDVAEAIVRHRDLKSLLHDLAGHLRSVIRFDWLAVLLINEERQTITTHLLEGTLHQTLPPGFEVPVNETAVSEILDGQKPLVVSDVSLAESKSALVSELLEQEGVRSYCLLPLTMAQRRLGALGFGSSQAGTFDSVEMEFLQRVADQVAVAVENALNLEKARAYQETVALERDRYRLLLEISNAMVSSLDFRGMFVALSNSHRKFHPRHDYSSFSLFDQKASLLRIYAIDFPQGKGLIRLNTSFPLEDSPAGWAFTNRESLIMSPIDTARFPAPIASLLVEEGIRSCCWVPVVSHNRALGVFSVGSFRPEAFRVEELEYIRQVANQIAIGIENALAFQEIAELKDKLAEEKLYLEDEIRTELHFDEIVGESPSLKRVLEQVEIVAGSDSTVLILGETGTGKELFARAIHKYSRRRERTFVKLNCAAIPTGLLESELFGHEKGAFTGAIERKIGRLELANQGTLFLDEVGDIPLELQPKLLRALQEREFERLGSARTIKVDVRLVAATNRDLLKMVGDQSFRSDLYYRLNVFPISVPPLRERAEDIPLLVRYFTQKHARRMDKRIETIPASSMQALARWHWPGNVRELENFIERAAILTRGTALNVPVAELKDAAEALPGAPMSLEDAERAHIRHVLREVSGVVGGPDGAAARLGMKRTTLISRMKKLGIRARE
jgi:formate hydrogenlyase transcriptional activator